MEDRTVQGALSVGKEVVVAAHKQVELLHKKAEVLHKQAEVLHKQAEDLPPKLLLSKSSQLQ